MTAIVCGMAYVASSCQRQEEFEAPSDEVVFSAATSYVNDTETRTIYSGQEFNATTQPVERIDWVPGDNIRILNVSTGQAANYTVGAPTDQSEKSVASVTADATKLTWGTGATNTFWAVYPSGAMDVSTNAIGSTIQATQSQTTTHTGKNGATVKNPTMNDFAFMVAKVTANNGENVTLPFAPAFTAFEFYLGIKDLNATVSSFEMTSTSTALTGRWSWNGTSFTCPDSYSAGTNDKITVNFPSGTTISPSAPLRFTVFALPQNLEDVTLKFVLSSGVQVTLPIRNKTFTACKKYRITTPELDWVYKIEEIPDTTFYGHNSVSNIPFIVKSYRYHPSNPNEKYAVPWHLEYSTTGEANTYSTTNANIADFDMHTGSNEYGNGVGTSDYPTGEPRAADIVRINPNHDINHPSAGQAARDALAHATPRGSSDAPFDLSKHPIYGNIDGPEGNMNTANCYVVSAPGYYKFPCVYGNAILNGQDNKSAYDPYGSGAPLASVWSSHASQADVYMTEHFRNALDEAITSPYIFNDFSTLTNYDAVVVWQDTDEDDEIIKYGEDDLKVVGSGSNAYIQFYIDPANIKQGNIVIALRGQANSNTKRILWSWHIWVSERNLTPVSSREFMPVNLGWVDLTDAAVDKYTDRINYYKVVQDPQETGVTGDTEDFWIKQIGDIEQIKSNVGGNPFYQWGRKDPITPQSAKRTSNTYQSALSTYGPTYIKTFVNSVPYYDGSLNWNGLHQSRYDEGITTPFLPLADPTTHSWICGQFYPPISAFAHTSLGRGYNSGSLVDITNWVEINANQHIHSGADAAQLRQVASCVYNLWNAAAWKSDDFGGSNKYKTVYDPCPVGFCVPTLDSFYGLSASEDQSGDGMNLNVSGTSVFFPYAGARVFHGDGEGSNTYENNTYRSSGFYWTDTPSQTGKSNSYDPNTGTNNTWAGWWWYQFAKSLRFSHPSSFDYVPEDNHWGAENQTQRKGFDDVRANAFSVRPIADPKYTAPSQSPSAALGGSINSFNNGGEIPE